jgi:hypothetical protein
MGGWPILSTDFASFESGKSWHARARVSMLNVSEAVQRSE